MDPEDDFGFVADDFGFEEGDPLPGSAEVPSGYREEGTRVHHLPGISFEVDAETGEGETTFSPDSDAYEERLIEKAPSAHDVRPGTQVGPDRRSALERLATAATQVAGDRLIDPLGVGSTAAAVSAAFGSDARGAPEMVGREQVTPDSLGRAVELYNRQRERGVGLGESLSNAASVAMPTAETDEDIIGRDLRPQAVWQGLGNAVLYGQGDEVGAALRPGARSWLGERGSDDVLQTQPETYATRRDALRRQARLTDEQAPTGTAVGAFAGSTPLAMLPGGQSTALARLGAAGAQGAVVGGLRGAGESEAETATGVVNDALLNAGAEGALAALFQVGGEVIGAGGRALGRQFSPQGLQGLQDRATHSGLEARGIWGQRAMDAVRDFPGGEEAFLARLDEAGAPMDPRRMPDFIEAMLEREGRRFSAARDAVDAPVDMTGVAADLEGLAAAQGADTAPLSGSENVAERLLERAQRAREAGQMSMDAAHQERRTLDQSINWGNPDQSVSVLGGQRQAMRRSLSQRMAEAADAAGVGDEWRSANRDYGFAAELDDLAHGAARRNMQGGITGANSRAQGLSNIIRGGGPGGRFAGLIEATIGPLAGQELRNLTPGFAYRSINRILPTLRAAGPAGEQFARILEGAQDGMGMPAAHYLLMQTRPEYRALIEPDQEQTSE